MRILIDMRMEPAALLDLQQQEGITLDIVEPEERVRPLPAELLREAEVLFCTFPPQNHDEMKKLRWIQISSAGYSQLFGLNLPARGIRATNARGCFDIPVAEWNLAMMINLARNLRQMIRNQDAGVWERPAQFQREVRGLTVGLWGYGGIARETARLARQMGMRVHVLSRQGIGPARNVYTIPGTGDPAGTLPDRIFLGGEREAFLAGLDFLILTMPLTKTTEGIVGDAELAALARHAFVLNPARGPLIQEQALLRALREQWIAGAAIDTHYKYPLPPDHPLWQFPNVILTPHISGSSLTQTFLTRLSDIFLQNVKRFRAGDPILNELSPAQLAGC
jgi:phosphoglycerate dehydrogenase-like enzyme